MVKIKVVLRQIGPNAISKHSPATRSSASACDETSMTTAFGFCGGKADGPENIADSGVVREAGTSV